MGYTSREFGGGEYPHAATPTEAPDVNTPAPEEDIIPVTEIVEETLPDAGPDPDGLDDDEADIGGEA